MTTRQGVTAIHLDDAREEQSLRIRAVELAQVNISPDTPVDQILEGAEKILAFITPKTVGEDGMPVSVSKGDDSESKSPKSKLVHFAS